MSERHDPLADPLTPYWRKKVEWAARAGATGTPPQGPTHLTELQREVMADLSAGMDHATVGARHGLKLRTVQQVEGRAKASARRAERFRRIGE